MLRHFAARRAAHFFFWGFGSVAAATACSAGGGGKGLGDGDGDGNGGVATGGTSSGGVAGVPIGGVAGTISGASGAGGGPDCAGDLVMGQPVPLDVYIMLDISGSMLANTGAAGTKWEAVKGALRTFLNDPASAGLSVAIQYFPLQKAGVPASCAADAECTAEGGTCLMKYCVGYNDGYAQCNSTADCMNALVKDDGPCVDAKCRLSGATCTDDASCQVRVTNGGECIELGRCEHDPSLVCEAGTQCTATSDCVAVTSNFCVQQTQCDQDTYATPAVEFGTLPDAAPAIIASIDAQMPRGETPSRPALRGAIDHARAWATSHA
ncbi:MAG TPA: hypothetical protein VFZ53_27485, partial [Polyangiaceae bacterium]